MNVRSISLALLITAAILLVAGFIGWLIMHTPISALAWLLGLMIVGSVGALYFVVEALR